MNPSKGPGARLNEEETDGRAVRLREGVAHPSGGRNGGEKP